MVNGPTPEILLQLAQQLPASPHILLKLGVLLNDMSCSLEDIAKLLRRDATLATRIIKISNSPVYSVGSDISSVEDAVRRVGFTEAYRLTTLAATAQLADQNLSFYGHTGAQLRDNTFVTAFALEALARRAKQDSRAAYATALLRSIGKLVLERFAKTQTPPPQCKDSPDGTPLIAREEMILGCNNATVAGIILESWNFPPAMTEPIRQHYLLVPPTGPHAAMAHLLNLASGIAGELGHALPGEAGYWGLRQEKLAAADAGDIDLEAVKKEALDAFQAVRSSL
jgi:HD-like signal output (HDOD) protein